MVDMMEHSYPLHGDTRSMSSLASTIIPVVSDASPLTSFSTSPMEIRGFLDLPIELKVPLPASSTCSEDEGRFEEPPKGAVPNPEGTVAVGNNSHQDDCAPPVAVPDVGVTSMGIPSTANTQLQTGSLDELTELVRMERYRHSRTLSAQKCVDSLSLSCGLNGRLICISAFAYDAMLDHFKADNQAGFAESYEGCEQLVEACNARRRYPPRVNMYGSEDSLDTEISGDLSSSWLQNLLPVHQNAIFGFLAKIRTDPEFLADRITNLSSSELVALSFPYQSVSVVDSVLQNHSHGKPRSHDSVRRIGSASSRPNRLRTFHQGEPFFALFNAVFDRSSTPGSLEDLRRIDIWSTTCAKTITQGKRGSDELLIATLDAFASFQDWPLKPKLEMYLMKILQEGAFLLDASSKELVDFKQQLEIRNANAAIACSNFFDKALKDLFKILTEGRPLDSIPLGVLEFARAVLRKIKDSRIRTRARNFIAAKWYFSLFLSKILVYPESQGLMMTYHIGATARRVVLKELVVRMQKHVIDVTSPWSKNLFMAPDIEASIGRFFQFFEPLGHENPLRSSILAHEESGKDVSQAHLMLSPQDLEALVNVIHPESPPSSSSTNFGQNGKGSSASSIAGSSTLTSVSVDHSSAIAFSAAPSISGTSMTSNTMLSEALFVDSQIKDRPASPLQNVDGASCKPLREEVIEDLGPQLRSICDELSSMVETEKVSRAKPFADQWAIVYISKNGKELSSIPMEVNVELWKPSTVGEICELQFDRYGKDYTALREAVIRLMDDRATYEYISGSLEISEIGSGRSENSPLPLEALFKGAIARSQSRFEFSNAHLWWESLQILRHILTTSSRMATYEALIHLIASDLRVRIHAYTRTQEHIGNWLKSMDTIVRRQQQVLDRMSIERNALRLKMWYVSDVRHSSTYEDALHVTRALRAMASPARPKQPGSITNWARHRLRNATAHDKSESQILEALSAQRDYGGPSKLTDEQVELTSRWLTRNSIENFCKGEERIHRFCFEVQKCVNRLVGVSLLESPVLWSSRLFGREKSTYDGHPYPGSRDVGSNIGSTLWGHGSFQSPSVNPPASTTTFQNLKTNELTNNISRLWNAPRASAYDLIGADSFGFPKPQDPVLAGQSFTMGHTGYSPDIPLPSQFSATLGSTRNNDYTNSHGITAESPSSKRKAFAQQIKRALNSLLLSDLGYLLWAQGSETDAWVNLDSPCCVDSSPKDSLPIHSELANSGIRAEEASEATGLNVPYLHERPQPAPSSPHCHSPIQTANERNDSFVAGEHLDNSVGEGYQEYLFPYLETYKKLLEKFSADPDPYTKLEILYELEVLALNAMKHVSLLTHAQDSGPASSSKAHFLSNRTGARTISVPRTKATSLEEVIANCFERRAGTLKFNSPKRGLPPNTAGFRNPGNTILNTDDIVNALLSIFRNANLRPQTLFRDLQFIAAFVPPEILDKTARGKAFWDAGLAALALKEDLCDSMIDRAHQITSYHLSTSKRPVYDPHVPQHLGTTTLNDAAQLWIITAKEGSPTAARELGLFYLTHPEILSRVTLPFSKSKEVFRSTISNDRSSADSGGLDPLTFAVVFHWMELAANGGDKDAKDFLRGNGELSAVM